jgi:hypothetical protein
VNLLEKKDIQALYLEAIYQHLLAEGMNPNRAEAEAHRRMRRDDAL